LRFDQSRTQPGKGAGGHSPGASPRLWLPVTVLLAAFAVIAAIGPLAGNATAAPAGAGWLRVGDFAAAAPAIDEYIDAKLVTANVTFQQVTPYHQVTPGTHAVAIRTAGAPVSAAPITSVTASVPAGGASTVALVNGGSGVVVSVYQDDLSPPPPRNAKVRVVQAVSNVAAVDVFVVPARSTGATSSNVSISTTGPPAFSAVPLGSASPYADLPAGSYDVEFRAAGTTQIVLSAHNWPVEAGTVASVVVFSGPQGPTLEVLRDAAGTAAVPQGAMATGGGGMAHRGHGGMPIVLVTIPVLVAMAAGAWSMRRFRRPPALATESSATTGSLGSSE
jgi:hypothetical protein